MPRELFYLALDIYFWFSVVDWVAISNIYIHISMLVCRHITVYKDKRGRHDFLINFCLDIKIGLSHLRSKKLFLIPSRL